jgi:cytidine deaminase
MMKKLKFESLDEQAKFLVISAIEVRKNAYSPYSNFKVGAALESESGKIYKGCNVESADFTLTTHAEMAAIDSMVSSGDRKINAIAIAMESNGKIPVPCGLCRQKISEFALDNTVVYAVDLTSYDRDSTIYKFIFNDLLPFSFNSRHIK